MPTPVTIIAALALAIAACGPRQPTRREFHDGPMVRGTPAVVRPGYAPAGAGLPEYLPGEPEPSYPHAPPGQRILPHTPKTASEPTIWATNGLDVENPSLFGIALPIPPSIPAAEAVVPVGLCAQLLMDAANRLPREKSLVEAMPVPRRSCAVATMYAFCVAHLRKAMLEAKEHGTAYDAKRLAAVEASAIASVLFFRDRCPHESLLTDEDRFAWSGIVTNFTEHWRAIVYE